MVSLPDGAKPGSVDPRLPLSPAQLKSRRMRNVAIGLLVGFLVLLVYVLTIAKLGPGIPQSADLSVSVHRTPEQRHARRRTFIASGVVAAVALSLGMSFAAVPLYRMFCQATGFAGTTQVADKGSATPAIRVMTVRFDANVAPGLDWSFEPDSPSISLRTGTTATVYFKVTNRSSKPASATAIYNVAPDVVGEYFNKIACFCFAQQTLAAHETLDMPVVFFLDPALETDETMKAVDTVTLSYTFFAPKGADKPLAEQQVPAGTPPRSRL